MLETRNSLDSTNLQEMLDSAGSSALGGRATRGLCQYETPKQLAALAATRLLRAGEPRTLYDPQCFTGALLNAVDGFGVHRYGIEIDRRFIHENNDLVDRVVGNCVDVMSDIRELYGDVRFFASVCNPPFSLTWNGQDSTQWTWDHVIDVSNRGVMFANRDTILRLGINRHPYFVDMTEHDFPGVSATIAMVYWANPNPPLCTAVEDLNEMWATLRAIQREKRKGIPKYNVWYDPISRTLRTYLSTFEKKKRNLKQSEISEIIRIDHKRPETIAIEKTVRWMLQRLVDEDYYTVSPEAEAVIKQSVRNAELMSKPIMPPTDFSLVAWAGESDRLRCEHSRYGFKERQYYRVKSGTYHFKSRFTVKKQHLTEDKTESFTLSHNCLLSGIDSQVEVFDSDGVRHVFREKGLEDKATKNLHPDTELFQIFRRPKVPTIRDTEGRRYDQIMKTLQAVAKAGNFQFYPGQDDYTARMSLKDFGYVCAETGVGKTLIFICLLALKQYQRALVVAPQSTIAGDEHTTSQWIAQLNKFAPYFTVYELYSKADYYALVEKHGELPPGIYVSYYEAMFRNESLEFLPPSMNKQEYYKAIGLPMPKDGRSRLGDPYDLDEYQPVGTEKGGIRSIAIPNLATLAGDAFDFIGFDEGHCLKNPDSQIGSSAIRLQPRYRYVFSATPVPNSITDLFSLSGWLCCPDWYKGGVLNSVWPFRREDIGDFSKNFQCTIQDLTQEELNDAKAKPGARKSQVKKKTAIISNPAVIVKLTSPFMGYVTKQSCNPLYVKPEVVDLRVPMSEAQQKLYNHFLDLKNIHHDNAMVRKSLQIQMLRSVTADPSELFACSVVTPKTIGIMELLCDMLNRGEQCVVSSARLSLTEIVANFLDEQGIPFGRIDSTMNARQQVRESIRFQKGDHPIQLMGVKCSQGHSYERCPNIIVPAIEWNNGALEQTLGRTDRLNSIAQCKAFVLLHGRSVEDYMFDTVMVKDDAAKIVLRGQRLPRDFKPVDLGDIIATAAEFDAPDAISDANLQDQWETLRGRMKAAYVAYLDLRAAA